MLIRQLRVVDLTLTLTRYSAGLKLQDAIADERKQGIVSDTLILLQHSPVYTLGKRGTAADFKTPREKLESTGAEICEVPRGGEVTFHGPGQLVAYPILGIRQAGLGARAYVESLEDSLVNCVAKYGIAARGRVPGATGVWVDERKIAAIGVRISHGISSHGVALNVTTDLSYFDHIVPCGIPDKEVTSVQREILLRRQGPLESAATEQQVQPQEQEQQGDPSGRRSGWGGSGGISGWADRSKGEGGRIGRGSGDGAGSGTGAGQATGMHVQGAASVAVVSQRLQQPEFRQVVNDFVEAFRQRLGFTEVAVC